jgi:biopolymer transport protein ExbB
MGPVEQGDTGFFAPGSTTAILLSSLTVDGWVVIAILAVMGVISWWIMYSKMRYINGIAKGNHAFMNVWKHVSKDLTVLDEMEGDKVKTLGGKISPEGQRAMRQSSVFRIYHMGSEEIRHRKDADGESFVDKGLSGRSIQAIKASMDGVLVRESQKLSRLIVLLTICISGGPFLGLLGTVIGVMITFASIAAAGDVNVNAIAPGIAAALVATVAGLAVAIPALFGYNYIQSRVKEATTDMHVFIDEFVTKMAEFYPDRRG